MNITCIYMVVFFIAQFQQSCHTDAKFQVIIHCCDGVSNMYSEMFQILSNISINSFLASIYPNLNIPGSEQKLSIQVRFLNDVHICDYNFSVWSSSKAHHGPIFQHFTANGTSSNLGWKICILLFETLFSLCFVYQ